MKQHQQQAQLLLLTLQLLTAPLPGARAAGSAELFLHGDSPAAHGQHAPWTYDAAGDDWSGTCSTGQAQSPINLPLTTTAALIDPQHRAVFELGVAASNGTNVIALTNTGHSVQVSWAQGSGSAFAPKITLAIQGGVGCVRGRPLPTQAPPTQNSAS
jgi:carbonic anhydrase